MVDAHNKFFNAEVDLGQHHSDHSGHYHKHQKYHNGYAYRSGEREYLLIVALEQLCPQRSQDAALQRVQPRAKQIGQSKANYHRADRRLYLPQHAAKIAPIIDNEEENNTIKDLKNNYEFKTVSLNTISTLSASDRKDKKDYISIMMDNINSIKLEVN